MRFQKKLLEWFRKNQRPLPWRARCRPYEVWVSEMMLQQTQMETVLPYFRRWIRAFPTIESLAASDERKVLKLWEGLGYYSRARNLHESARRIVERHGGVFPENYETILSLKGVGRYSAGAIASIAFNQEKPIVDGNVLRVLSRLYAVRKPIDVEKNKEFFWKLEERLIPKGQARFFNQALMELGALVCTPQNPACAVCPVKKFCTAFKQNRAEAYPVRSKKRKSVKVEAAAVVLSKDGRYFVRRRPLGEIMGGLWEFPEWKLARDRKLPARTIQKIVSLRAKKEFGSKPEALENLGMIRRNYTHHLETMHVFRAESPEAAKPKTRWPSAWISKKDFGRYPFSSAHAKIVKLLT